MAATPARNYLPKTTCAACLADGLDRAKASGPITGTSRPSIDRKGHIHVSGLCPRSHRVSAILNVPPYDRLQAEVQPGNVAILGSALVEGYTLAAEDRLRHRDILMAKLIDDFAFSRRDLQELFDLGVRTVNGGIAAGRREIEAQEDERAARLGEFIDKQVRRAEREKAAEARGQARMLRQLDKLAAEAEAEREALREGLEAKIRQRLGWPAPPPRVLVLPNTELGQRERLIQERVAQGMERHDEAQRVRERRTAQWHKQQAAVARGARAAYRLGKQRRAEAARRRRMEKIRRDAWKIAPP